jgi:hypothetical protein
VSRSTTGYGGSGDSFSDPAVAIDDSGAFLVTFVRQYNVAPNVSDYDVVLRRFNAAGQPLANESVVHDFRSTAQWSPDVTTTTSGANYSLVWMSVEQDGSYAGVFGRSFGPVNTKPIAHSNGLSTIVDLSVALQLTGDDADPDVAQTLGFSIVTPPAHGTLTGFDPVTGRATYVPTAGFAGVDSFQFAVRDDNQIGGGALTSLAATVQITVRTVDQAIVVADADDDDRITGFELLAWQRGFGSAFAADAASGDTNGDGKVDAVDLDAWLTLFGESLDPAGVGVSVASQAELHSHPSATKEAAGVWPVAQELDLRALFEPSDRVRGAARYRDFLVFHTPQSLCCTPLISLRNVVDVIANASDVDARGAKWADGHHISWPALVDDFWASDLLAADVDGDPTRWATPGAL